jgi:hypothetical protein
VRYRLFINIILLLMLTPACSKEDTTGEDYLPNNKEMEFSVTYTGAD